MALVPPGPPHSMCLSLAAGETHTCVCFLPGKYHLSYKAVCTLSLRSSQSTHHRKMWSFHPKPVRKHQVAWACRSRETIWSRSWRLLKRKKKSDFCSAEGTFSPFKLRWDAVLVALNNHAFYRSMIVVSFHNRLFKIWVKFRISSI